MTKDRITKEKLLSGRKSNINWVMSMSEYMLAFGVGFIVICGILARAGTLSSGFHFLDDHELIRMNFSLSNGHVSVGQLMLDNIRNDLHWRFRPFYWVERVGCTALFGANMYVWNIYTALKGCLTFGLLALTARNLKFNRCVSLLFASIIMLGPQFTPWYRSANQENTGLLLLALSLWMISRQKSVRRVPEKLWNAFICVTVIICGLIKESFTLCIPALAVFRFWMEYSENEKKVSECIKSSWIFYTVMIAAFVNHVCWIIFGSGVDNVSYAGFHEGTALSDYYYGMRDSLLVYLKWYTFMGGGLIAVVAMCYQFISKKVVRENWGLLIIGLYIMGVQLLAHAKSLMWERYIIPYIVGYAIVFVLIGYRIFTQDIIRRRIYVLFLALLLLLEAPVAYDKALDYAYDGEVIGVYLQDVLNSTEPDDIIIGAFADEELNLATASWLEANGRAGEYVYSWENGSFEDKIILVASPDKVCSWENASVALCYGQHVTRVMELMGDVDNLEYAQYGGYCVIRRRG